MDRIFPKEATKSEREVLTNLIGSVNDKDLGFLKAEKPVKYKFGVRCLLLNEKEEIGFVKSTKYDYLQIPGGGMEPGETIEDALRREIAEEMGYEIKNLQPLGYYSEERMSDLNKHSWNTAISFVYLAKAAKEVGTNYMPDEIEEGFEPVWLNLNEAIKIKNKEFQSILKSKASYSGTFSDFRDLTLLNYYRDNIYAKN